MSEKIILKSPNKTIDSVQDLKQFELNIKLDNRRIFDLINSKNLDIQPFFQRNYVWTDKKASELIESILLNVPIPPIYAYLDHNTGKEFIIDGQQRIKSGIRFANDEFKLKGLTTHSSLNDLYFSQLETKYKSTIENFSYNINTITNINDEKVIFEIFRRYNTGAVFLNAQEIRNCIYHGDYNAIIKELSTDKIFKDILNNNKIINRMEKEEYVLRFLAIYQDFNKYDRRINAFLNDHMALRSGYFDKLDADKKDKEAEQLKKIFRKSIEACNIVFGKNSFKNCYSIKTKEENKKIIWRYNSKIVYDLQMLGFVDFELKDIINNSDEIKNKFINLALNNSNFIPIKNKNSKIAVEYRINKWKTELQKIFKD